MEYGEDAERSGRPKKGNRVVSAESQAESGSGCGQTESEAKNKKSMPEA